MDHQSEIIPLKSPHLTCSQSAFDVLCFQGNLRHSACCRNVIQNQNDGPGIAVMFHQAALQAVQNICDAIVCKVIQRKITASFIRRADPTPCFIFKPRNCLRNAPPHLKENSLQFKNYFRRFSLKDSLYNSMSIRPAGPWISASLYIVETIKQASVGPDSAFSSRDRWMGLTLQHMKVLLNCVSSLSKHIKCEETEKVCWHNSWALTCLSTQTERFLWSVLKSPIF